MQARTIEGSTWQAEDARQYIEDRVHQVPWSGCWLWALSVDTAGYAHARVPSGTSTRGTDRRLAHRVAYQAFVGSIPNDMVVMHTCDVRSCCNADRARKNRSNRKYTGGAKLTEESVREIRRRADAGEPYTRIAADVGVSYQSVSLVARRLSWKKVA